MKKKSTKRVMAMAMVTRVVSNDNDYGDGGKSNVNVNKVGRLLEP